MLQGKKVARRFLIIAAACFGHCPGERADRHQVFGHTAARASIDYAEKYFGEEVGTLSKGTIKVEV
jgi:hypothetical protein